MICCLERAGEVPRSPHTSTGLQINPRRILSRNSSASRRAFSSIRGSVLNSSCISCKTRSTASLGLYPCLTRARARTLRPVSMVSGNAAAAAWGRGAWRMGTLPLAHSCWRNRAAARRSYAALASGSERRVGTGNDQAQDEHAQPWFASRSIQIRERISHLRLNSQESTSYC